uniref:Cation-transporting P-type ATPase C-terminal domain-containing protein n=2 Tax=Octactis speculum TaxID=3111310 RepID=A0A7S2DNG1_9STRA|mmetsp:Transcript_51764/g.70577  ORF Transcript_51764/g.70577 Transcript_51764/m.70577 type:complete len:149 (+) Transcript_51764:105-551(+)
MIRNIAVQSIYQLVLLVSMLKLGDKMFPGIELNSTVHYTLLFNVFVFCQVFNELNARSITNDMNILKDMHRNPMFQIILVFTVIMQYGIVQYGGDFTKTAPLDQTQWIHSVALGALTIPIGFLMRLIPVSENMNDFAGYTSLDDKKRN